MIDGLFQPLVLILLLVAALLGLALGSLLQRLWRDRRDRRQGSLNYDRGYQLEEDAAALLEDCGYTILKRSPELTMILRVEQRETPFPIKPDFLVEKDGVQFIVEVKYWQAQTPAIHNANIRRQIIEYLAASGLPCLLLEMPEGYVSLIDADLEMS
jgi:hypothetical protein